MGFISRLSLYASVTCLVFLVAGLFRPWIMLWWEDVQNRRKVIKLYGTLAILFYAIHMILNLLNTYVQKTSDSSVDCILCVL